MISDRQMTLRKVIAGPPYSVKKRGDVPRLNRFGVWIVLTIAFAGFQHLPWWLTASAVIVGFAWYQFDKASIGIVRVVRNGAGWLEVSGTSQT
jgi:hypothetical protein